MLLPGYAQQRGGRRHSVFLISFADVLQSRDEIIQYLSRNHDAVAVRAYLFGNANYTPTGIALQVDEEGFAIGNNFFCADNVVVHCR